MAVRLVVAVAVREGVDEGVAVFVLSLEAPDESVAVEDGGAEGERLPVADCEPEGDSEEEREGDVDGVGLPVRDGVGTREAHATVPTAGPTAVD